MEVDIDIQGHHPRTAEERMALGVILRAIMDATYTPRDPLQRDVMVTDHEQADARVFLLGHGRHAEGIAHWCAAGRVSLERVTALARSLEDRSWVR